MLNSLGDVWQSDLISNFGGAGPLKRKTHMGCVEFESGSPERQARAPTCQNKAKINLMRSACQVDEKGT